MPYRRLAVIAPLAIWLAAAPLAPAAAAEVSTRVCLKKDEQRAAVAEGRAIPLAKARAAIKSKNKGEMLHARLCQGPNGLVYVLTLLARNGKVTRVTVDAVAGVVIGGR